jgi:dGTPase
VRLFLVPHHVREETERREQDQLSPYAAVAVASVGRANPEPPDPVRTCYQRDRDRVLHSKSFRRLKHKTQVFIDPDGDHYRTRLTHTLEVAQIARTIGRALRLNEDLIEAIALAHDLGHPPFGHAGEAALNDARQHFGDGEFRHDLQSIRIVDILEPLNLTEETRLGIGGHSKGRKDLADDDGMPVSTLEAAVVRISDRIAYLNHDLDDALRSGLIPGIPNFVLPFGVSHGDRIGTMVEDVIQQSLGQPAIRLSAEHREASNHLKEWLFENVYLRYPQAFPDIRKAKGIVAELYAYHRENGPQEALDYVAGMTDRFAIEAFTALRIPARWRA